MANSPETIPAKYAPDATLTDAYQRGWNHGHGFACHNVPGIGQEYWLDGEGRVIADADNIRDIHSHLCTDAESNSRQFSPFEFTAHEFNTAEHDENGVWNPDLEGRTEEIWEAFEAGTSDSISANLATYTDEDYGIEAETDETE
jgi:hypothetical protein